MIHDLRGLVREQEDDLRAIALLVAQVDGDYSTNRLAERVSSLMDSLGRSLDGHKAEIARLRRLVCECGHEDDYQAGSHNPSCPVRSG